MNKKNTKIQHIKHIFINILLTNYKFTPFIPPLRNLFIIILSILNMSKIVELLSVCRTSNLEASDKSMVNNKC